MPEPAFLHTKTNFLGFGGLLDSHCVAMVESPVSHLNSMTLTAACEVTIVFRSDDYTVVC